MTVAPYDTFGGFKMGMNCPVTRACDDCSFAFPTDRPGGFIYVIDEHMERIATAFGCEVTQAVELTGIEIRVLERAGRLGYLSDCICRECLQQFSIDLDRDPKQCPQCESVNVVSARGAVGSKCPHCSKGTVRELVTESE